MLYTENKYILKLLLNKVTAWIEALVIWGNAFLYACVKEECVEIHMKVLKLWSTVFH
jgi:hypothetical protein